MYTEQELTAIKQQQNKRWIILSIPCVLCLAVIVYSLTVRIEALTTIATVLMLALLIFFYDLTIKPLHCYQIHIQNMLYGRKRELDCTYHSIDADVSLVDGVQYYAVTVLQPDEKGDSFERLLYWDVQKPFPTLTPSQPLHITYHDKMIAELG